MIRLPKDIDKKFIFDGKVIDIKPLGEGLINDTFFAETEGNTPDYILQRKNKQIFTNIPLMMDNISKVTAHLKEKIVSRGGNPLREAMTIIPEINGALYYKDEKGDFWTASLYIEDTVTHEKATSTRLAYKGGEAIGEFHAMLADMNETLHDILPGFHNIRYRFEQWNSVLKSDPMGRRKEVEQEISWIRSRREEMLNFRELIETGEIPTRITHNDTKISNFLFDSNDNVLCVIDLDTVLSSTCLNDFGDAIRSYANTGNEDDEDLRNISLNIEIYESYRDGYLSKAESFLTPLEKKYLSFSARYITYEQALRFLMDYIDGDKYYKIKYPEHNLVRARNQFKLLRSMEDSGL